MKYPMYRIIRLNNYEEWVVVRADLVMDDRVILFYDRNMIRFFIVSGDPNCENDSEYMLQVQNLFHHQRDFNDQKLEIVIVDYNNQNGKNLSHWQYVDIEDNIIREIRKNLNIDISEK